jgi:hypothetical protein
MKYVYLSLSYLAVFILGLYASGCKPVEPYRWAVTSFFFIFFIAGFFKPNNPQNL